MRLSFSAFFASAVLIFSAFAATAHADIISTYSLSDFTFQSGATATGSVNVDITTGLVTQANLVYANGSSVETFIAPITQGTASQLMPLDSSLPLYWLVVSNSLGDEFSFAFSVPALTLPGYGIGDVCSLHGTICPVIDPYGNHADFVSGYLYYFDNYPRTDALDTGTLVFDSSVVVGQTPEASSFILLGTGVLGIAGAVRRRVLM